MPTTPNVRVVVRLPYNRPDQPLDDPPRIEWNSEKANILWEVIARSRASDSGGTDWKGLAAHLGVPLPYLLYRAQTRYEDDLRGLQDITGRGALSPSATTKPSEDFPFLPEKPTMVHRTSSRMGSSARRLSASRLSSPLQVRARLSSLGHHSPSRPKKASSSSTLTLRSPAKKNIPHLQPTSPSSSEATDSEDEEAAKEEEADRKVEEQEALDKKLQNLQKLITGDALGLISSPRSKGKGKERAKETDRGRTSPRPMQRSFRGDELSSRSQSVSSASSPQGSIPSIPSPPPESQPQSPISRHLSPSKSSSPPAVSPRSVRGQSHLRYAPMVGRTVSEQGSNHGSSASSFSDISDASLSASALESALLSNIRGGGGSRLSVLRSRFVGRGGGVRY